MKLPFQRGRSRRSSARPSIIPNFDWFEERNAPDDLYGVLQAPLTGSLLLQLTMSPLSPRRDAESGDSPFTREVGPSLSSSPGSILDVSLGSESHLFRGESDSIISAPARSVIVSSALDSTGSDIAWDLLAADVLQNPFPREKPTPPPALPGDPSLENGSGGGGASSDAGGVIHLGPSGSEGGGGSDSSRRESPSVGVPGDGAGNGPEAPGASNSPGTVAASSTPPAAARRHELLRNYSKVPMQFEVNRGQTNAQVKFLSRGPGYSLFVTPDKAVFSLNRPSTPEGRRLSRQVPSSVRDVVALNFVGASTSARVTGLNELKSRTNYFSGSNPQNWRVDIPNYGKLQVHDLYPGIDAVYYGNQRGQLEYDLVVRPGASPSTIQLQFQGVQPLAVDGSGHVSLRTGGGRMLQQAPVIYQMVGGVRQTVSGQYVVSGTDRLGFQVGTYNPSLPLIIDPVLVYGSYLGGAGTDIGYGIAVDGDGLAYVTGLTDSAVFPTLNPFQSSWSGSYDAFVTKLNRSGDDLIYSSYLGGSGIDIGYDIAVDLAGNAYIVGQTTSSSDFPTTTGAYDRTYNGGSGDAFVAKVNATGSALLYSTYLGGSGGDGGEAIAVDSLGQAAVVGRTGQPSGAAFPTTSGALKTAVTGTSDAFVTRLNSAGSSLLASTLIGGSADEYGLGVAVDESGNTFIAGATESNDFVTTGSVFQSTFGGTQDAFICKINSTATSRIYSTYLGGSLDDGANDLAIDRSGNAFVTGWAASTSGIATSGAYQTTYGGGTFDVFVTKINATGSAKVYSTYLGGLTEDVGHAIAVDAAGKATVVGHTDSSDFDLEQPLPGQDTVKLPYDGFVTQLNADGNSLRFSTYLGGSDLNPTEPDGSDDAYGVAVDLSGHIYVTGATNSTDFPTVDPPYQSTNGGGWDAFVVKIFAGVSPPKITSIADDTGSSSTDRITKDQTLTISGTAPSGSTVDLYLANVGRIASDLTVTSGSWSYAYSATLSEGTHTFYATAKLSGQTSLPSVDFPVVVDVTPPTVGLTVPAQTTSRGPQVRVTAFDLGGLVTSTVTIDVNLNYPVDEDFNDTGESGYTTGTLVNGTALITLPLLPAGAATYQIRARVTDGGSPAAGDLAGNAEGISPVQTLQVVAVGNPWRVETQVLRSDPLDGMNLEQLGNLRLVHALDLDRSPGSHQGGFPALFYNSNTVSVRPIVQGRIDTANTAALPSTITAVLTWNGGTAQSPITFNTTGFSPGDVLLVAAQVNAADVTSTGKYTWNLQVYSDGYFNSTVSGTTYVVVNDSSAFGAGWSFAGPDRLVAIGSGGSDGQLRIYGNGDWRFYQKSGSSYISPPGDNGTLSEAGGVFTYKWPDQSKWDFDTANKRTVWTSSNGLERITYTYDTDDPATRKLIGMTSIDNALSTFTYTGSQVTKIETAGPRTFTLTYSGSKLESIKNPDNGLRTFTYDSGNRATREQFANLENNWQYHPDSRTLATLIWGTSTSPSVSTLSPAIVQGHKDVTGLARSPVEATSYDANARPAEATVTDPLSRKTVWVLDKDGRYHRQTAADGGIWQWRRDANGYVTVMLDAINRTTTFQRDAQGYVTITYLADGRTQQYQYQTGASEFHALTRFTNERGHHTSYSYYTGTPHLQKIEDAENRLTTYTWYTSGLVESVETPPLTDFGTQRVLTTYVYDTVDSTTRRLEKVSTSYGLDTIYSYDSNGHVRTTTVQPTTQQTGDPVARVTTTTHDALERLLTHANPLNYTVTAVYNGAGLLTSYTYPSGDPRLTAG